MRLPDSLASLRHRNMRLFFGGQAVSLVGTWMQNVAQSWLVWRLTHSEAALGVAGFLSQIPVLLVGPIGGSAADRAPRRKLVIVTQSVFALQAFALAAVTLTGRVNVGWIYALAALQGLTYAFDIPARQSLLADMAGAEFGNAIALNSSIVNGARMIGPAVAGAIVAALGEGLCFLGNGVSYLAIIWTLFLMRFVEPKREHVGGRGHLREGLAYASRTAHIRALLLLVGASSVFGSPYIALMPSFASKVLGGGPGLLGWLFAASGLGALVGAASLLRRKGLIGLGRRVAWGSTLFGVGLVAFSASPHPSLSMAALVLVGAGWMLQLAATNTLLQGLAPPELRGRVMGLYSSMFVGAAPLGTLAAGWLATRFGPQRAMAAGAAVVLCASLAFHLALPGLRRIAVRDFPQHFAPERAPEPESA